MNTNLQLFARDRRWKAGTEFVCGGLSWRVVNGHHESPDQFGEDLRLDLWTGGSWQPVKMETALMLVDFFTDNESDIHPLSNGRKGGEKFLEACRRAAQKGWEEPSGQISYDRAHKGG